MEHAASSFCDNLSLIDVICNLHFHSIHNIFLSAVSLALLLLLVPSYNSSLVKPQDQTQPPARRHHVSKT